MPIADFPIHSQLAGILASFIAHPQRVPKHPPGAGKTTQVPPWLGLQIMPIEIRCLQVAPKDVSLRPNASVIPDADPRPSMWPPSRNNQTVAHVYRRSAPESQWERRAPARHLYRQRGAVPGEIVSLRQLPECYNTRRDHVLPGVSAQLILPALHARYPSHARHENRNGNLNCREWSAPGSGCVGNRGWSRS